MQGGVSVVFPCGRRVPLQVAPRAVSGVRSPRGSRPPPCGTERSLRAPPPPPQDCSTYRLAPIARSQPFRSARQAGKIFGIKPRQRRPHSPWRLPGQLQGSGSPPPKRPPRLEVQRKIVGWFFGVAVIVTLKSLTWDRGVCFLGQVLPATERSPRRTAALLRLPVENGTTAKPPRMLVFLFREKQVRTGPAACRPQPAAATRSPVSVVSSGAAREGTDRWLWVGGTGGGGGSSGWRKSCRPRPCPASGVGRDAHGPGAGPVPADVRLPEASDSRLDENTAADAPKPEQVPRLRRILAEQKPVPLRRGAAPGTRHVSRRLGSRAAQQGRPCPFPPGPALRTRAGLRRTGGDTLPGPALTSSRAE
ncbi:PREDICTED: uncharacterized protein LOC109375568 [Hipposideros armiger]|uniref:Uncharacterized protein LOC109375568 n=1 Tax=Hipposideros armiger TaxID=186990 RepID=A0A8B7QFX3_HIPAR|nr:PREDICTED: uncharacterized protein LOC109375568 [Hipposideros armiger]